MYKPFEILPVVCLIVFALSFAIFLSIKRIKRGHLFESFNFFLLTYIPIYFVNAIYIYYHGSSHADYVTTELFYKGLILVILGLIFYTIGYYSSSAKILEQWFPKYNNALWSQTKLNIVCIVIVFVVILSLVLIAISSNLLNAMLNLKTRILAKSSGYWIWGLNLGKLGVWLLTANRYIYRKKFRFREIAYISFITVCALSTGSRRELFIIILGIILLRHYLYRKISYKALLLLLPIFIVLSIILQFQRNQTHQMFWHRIQSIEYSLHYFMKGTLGSFDYFLKVLNSVPKYVDFQYGRSLYYILLLPIPRHIFPDKPIPTSVFFMNIFYPNIYQRGTIIGIPILGDLYFNFHYIGVLIGMFLLGVISKAFYINLNNSKSALLIYIPFIESLIRSIRGGIQPLFLLIGMNVIPMFIILKFISSKVHNVYSLKAKIVRK